MLSTRLTLRKVAFAVQIRLSVIGKNIQCAKVAEFLCGIKNDRVLS